MFSGPPIFRQISRTRGTTDNIARVRRLDEIAGITEYKSQPDDIFSVKTGPVADPNPALSSPYRFKIADSIETICPKTKRSKLRSKEPALSHLSADIFRNKGQQPLKRLNTLR